MGMSDFYIASVPPLDSIGDKNAMNEEYKKLRYCIEYRSSEISDEEVIPLIKEVIEEAKKKFPEKVKALDEIEIKGKPLASTLEVDPLTILIIVVILRPIIVETWHEIVIPLLKRKLNIEPYEDYLKKMEEKNRRAEKSQ